MGEYSGAVHGYVSIDDTVIVYAWDFVAVHCLRLWCSILRRTVMTCTKVCVCVRVYEGGAKDFHEGRKEAVVEEMNSD